MTSALEHIFLAKMQRSLGPVTKNSPIATDSGLTFRVTAVNEPFINETVGNALIRERVGHGAMSIVFKATQQTTGRTVAVKILRASLCYDTNNVKRFQREARAVCRLNHPNLISVYDVGMANTGQPFMIMEFIEGKSLGDLLAERGPIPWQRALPLFIQACDGMAHAHDHGIIHRDLKPDNIMMVRTPNANDTLKIVDFGIVKLIDEPQTASQRLTATGEVWGSPVYMSPEQCSGNPVDARSDVYAMGLVFYELLTGRQCFSSEKKRISEIITKQLGQKPEAFASVRPDLQIPAWLEAIVMKALEKDPANRFQSMHEFKGELERSLLPPKATESVVKSGIHPAVVTPEPAENADEFVNKVVAGKYLVQTMIGEGGMSVVYKALQQSMNRTVAIKIMRDELTEEEAYRKRFQREAKALSSLSHPNLVSIYDVGAVHTGQSYIVMEFLKGAALSEVLDDKGFIAAKRAVPIFIQICDVMNYLHQQGVIHRDLKPHNIMLVEHAGERDFVKIVDFGILKYDDAKIIESQRLTASGDICGSPIYMSPEQILDEKLDGRCDIYSLGIAMYETLLGYPPFQSKRVAELLNSHINDPPKPFSQARPDLKLPPSLEIIVMRALEKDRDMRYQSMADIKQDLIVLNARLEQELGAIVRGESVSNLPPLPVAGKMSVTSSSGVMAAKLAKATESTNHQPAFERSKGSSSNSEYAKTDSFSTKKSAKALVPLAIAVVAVLLAIGGGYLLLPAINSGTKPQPSVTKNSEPPATKQEVSQPLTKEDEELVHPAQTADAPLPVFDSKKTAPNRNNMKKKPSQVSATKKKSRFHGETLQDEVFAGENANLPGSHSSGDSWKGVEQVNP